MESLRRLDNNQYPVEINIDRFHLRLATVADCLHDYFDHPELKLAGDRGVLDRMRMVILDHQYIGKETNSLVDDEVEDAQEQRGDEMPSIPIFRKGFNTAALDGLNLKALADRIGVKEETLRSAHNTGRRLDKVVMARLQSALNVGDEGCVSIDPTPPFSPEAKRARHMSKQLRTLHDAIAAGKDFDLNGRRRSALSNVKRGPATFDQIRIAVENHLTDKKARRFFADCIFGFWQGNANLFDNRTPGELAKIALIEDAIALASGANRSKAVRRARHGKAASAEERAKVRDRQAERARQMRAERKADADALLSIGRRETPVFRRATSRGGWRGDPADFKASEMFFSARTADEYAHAIKTLVAGSTGFPVRPFKGETRSALKAAARRGSAYTAWDQFGLILQKRISDRMKRGEADRMRKRLARRENKRDHVTGRVVDDAARRGAIGDDSPH